jgi:hypothetical protein
VPFVTSSRRWPDSESQKRPPIWSRFDSSPSIAIAPAMLAKTSAPGTGANTNLPVVKDRLRDKKEDRPKDGKDSPEYPGSCHVLIVRLTASNVKNQKRPGDWGAPCARRECALDSGINDIARGSSRQTSAPAQGPLP